MQRVETIAELQRLADAERAAGRRIALVPTMGALHAGHLALIEAARKCGDCVWVSIFVNPAQFNDPADLEKYPRNLEADLEGCEVAGVDLVFLPDAGEMYPPDCQTAVAVGAIAEPLCGASRPGHFDGVATIVNKLLLAAKPHVAMFGEKDHQQLALIRRMVRDFGFDVEIAGVPTVREADGLALSSRNVYLDPEARRQATVLVRALDAAQSAVEAGECDRERLLESVHREIAKAPLAEIDYAELRDAEFLTPAPECLAGPTVLALAVYFTPGDPNMGTHVRLIDNRVLHPQHTREDPPS
jgi:pantoate--beta-alanine ligase